MSTEPSTDFTEYAEPPESYDTPTEIEEIAPPVLRDQEDNVLRLVLNRADKRNPLSDTTIAALQDLLDEAAADDSVHVIVIASTGPAFCAGHDLKEMQAHRTDEDAGHAYFKDLFDRCSHLMKTIVRHPKPVIAEVDGVATAAGCQLVASCDLAYASDEAQFATPGVRIGLFCSTPMVALSRAVPRKKALHMLLTGEMVDAETAERIGLINGVVPTDTLTSETMAIAHMLSSSSARVLKIGKEAFQNQLDLPLDEAYAYASEMMFTNMLDADAAEGIGAFIDKREPNWPSKRPPVAPVPHVDHDSYTDEYIGDILRGVKTIAVVGASANSVRPSYFVMHYLLARGYRVIPVNPGQAGGEILGQRVYASLADIPDEIDMVDVFRSVGDVPQVVDETIRLRKRPQVLWMQLAIRDDVSARRAEDAGIRVVMNRCPKIEYGRLSGEINWIGFNRHAISSKKPKLGARYQMRDLLGRTATPAATEDDADGSLFD